MATSNNPAFSSDRFAALDQSYGETRGAVMTVQGTVSKTFLLLAVLSATALWSWQAASTHQLQPVVLPAAAIGGFVLALITIFKPTAAPWTAPVYAAFEGVFLGAFSYLIEHSVRGATPGIALQAVSMTCGTLFVMLFLYASRIIPVTDKLRMGIVAATGALCLVYFASFMLSMFGVSVPFLKFGGHDVRWVVVAFEIAVMALLWFGAPRELRPLTVLPMLVDPDLFLQFTGGGVMDF